MHPKSKAYFHLHLAVFFWGFTGVLGKAVSISAPALVWYRMLFTALIIGIIITFRKKWQRIPLKDMKKLYFIGFLFAVHWVAFYMSIRLAGASIAMLCLATASIFTAIISPLADKTRVKAAEVIIGLIAVAGVLVIYLFQDRQLPTGTQPGMHQSDFRLGIILGVITAIISAVFTVLNKPMALKYEFRNVVFHEMSSGFIFLCLAVPFYVSSADPGQYVLQGWDFLWLFCLVYFCTVLGQQLVIQALRQLSPFTVTLSVNLEPIYGIILAFLIFQENRFLGWPFYTGVAIIGLSLILQIYYTRYYNMRSRLSS